MASFSNGLSYLIAAQFQAVALLGVGWWTGSWLNEHHAQESFNWMVVTMSVAVLATIQTFYVVIKKVSVDASNSTGQSKPKTDGRP